RLVSNISNIAGASAWAQKRMVRRSVSKRSGSGAGGDQAWGAGGVDGAGGDMGASLHTIFAVSDAIPADLRRYHRQMLLPGFGVEGQRRLAASHAVVVGCGALGTVAAEALARAGVGTLTIIDRDIVESTNLQRQTLFTEADAERGTPKAAA